MNRRTFLTLSTAVATMTSLGHSEAMVRPPEHPGKPAMHNALVSEALQVLAFIDQTSGYVRIYRRDLIDGKWKVHELWAPDTLTRMQREEPTWVFNLTQNQEDAFVDRFNRFIEETELEVHIVPEPYAVPHPTYGALSACDEV